MATNLSLDPDLYRPRPERGGDAQEGGRYARAGGIHRPSHAEPHRRFVGQLEWDRSFDYKAERSRG